jgi:glycosyltransferase involved in cell wall biosynthesis
MPPPTLHQPLLDRESGKRPFAYATWEVDDLPERWPPALNLYERVFVPSEFNRKTFAEHGVTVPIDVVPHVARQVVPVPEGSYLDPIASDDFVFYTIGVWTTRKALEETVRAYLDTFDAKEKVVLVIKTDVLNHIAFAAMTFEETSKGPGHLGTSWWALAQILAEYDNPARVHLINENIPPQDIDHLHTRGDCYVSLTRSEGWGLPAFDAFLFGNPVIMTGWSGQLDYLGDDYPLSVRYSLETTMNSPDDHCHMRSQTAHWAEPDCAHAGELMRWVIENRQQANAIAKDRHDDLRKRFAPEIVCRQLAQLMGFDIPGS